MKINNYTELTEVSGTEVSEEQVCRIHNRYAFSSKIAKNKNVLEISCGSGQGSNIIESAAKTFIGIDVDPALVSLARKNSKNILLMDCFEIEKLNRSFDVIIIHEAIYYYRSLEKFFGILEKILNPNGKIIISQPNKHLYDFVPSAKSYTYIGNNEFQFFFNTKKWDIKIYGFLSVKKISTRQKILRPIKFIAQKLKLIPKKMSGKFFLKKIYFGSMVKMPTKLNLKDFKYIAPSPISSTIKNKSYKVIYTVLTKK